MVNPGRLRHRLTIQRVTEDQSDTGQPVQTWTDLATRWAGIQSVLGQSKEEFTGEQVTGEITHRITMRYYPGLTSKDRLLFGTRVFNIVAIDNVMELNHVLEIRAKEVVK